VSQPSFTAQGGAALDVIGLGELLWDCLPTGSKPGGAPANVAFHAQQLGLAAATATRVGNDPLGEELLAFLQSQRLRTDLVQRDELHHTGTVDVVLLNGQPRYQFRPESAWDFLECTPEWQAALGTARAIVFGSLAQRGAISQATIQACLQQVPATTWTVFDANLRPPHFTKDVIQQSLQHARVLKLNTEEVGEIANFLDVPLDSEQEFAEQVLAIHPRVEWVCVTRGADGAALFGRGCQAEVPGVPVVVVDTVGAGDAFTAALLEGLLNNRNPQQILAFANKLGALVASRPGAMPDLSAELPDLKQAIYG